MPLPAKGRVKLERLQVSLPDGLYRECEAIVAHGRRWTSVVDFIRYATANEVERYKREHPGGPPPR